MAYTDIASVRALDDLSDATAYPDIAITAAIAEVTETIDQYCGATFEVRAFSYDLLAGPGSTMLLPVPFLVSLTLVTIDGVTANTSGWLLTQWGEVRRTDGTFVGTSGAWDPLARGQSLVHAEGTAGITPTPPGIIWAATMMAGQRVRDMHSRIPDRAMQLASQFGSINLAQAGGPDRPTSMPEVNAVLRRHRHRPYRAF